MKKVIIGVLSDSNDTVFYFPEDKTVTVNDILITGVDTVEIAIAKCQHLFLGFIASTPPDQVLIKELSYDDEWYQPPLECVSCGCSFMMEDGNPSFCPGCGKQVSTVIRRKND